jgi:hypothetical protein
MPLAEAVDATVDAPEGVIVVEGLVGVLLDANWVSAALSFLNQLRLGML